MLIKTLLNKVERFKSFIYGDSKLMAVGSNEALVIDIKPRRNSKPECPECGKRGKMYDTQPVRLFEYVPIWSFKVYFRYAPRRVCCPHHGIKVEALPWAYGKEQMTYLVPGLSGPLGKAAFLEGDGRHLQDQLGQRLPGGQVRRRLRSCPPKPRQRHRDRC